MPKQHSPQRLQLPATDPGRLMSGRPRRTRMDGTAALRDQRTTAGLAQYLTCGPSAD